jgi:hypothetical protein
LDDISGQFPAKFSTCIDELHGRVLFHLMVVIPIQTTNLLRVFRTLHLSTNKAVLSTVARLSPQPAVGPELSLAAERYGVCISAIKRAARIGPMRGIWR